MGQDPSPIKLQMLGREQLHTEGVRHVQGLCEAFACLPSLVHLHVLLELRWKHRPTDSVDCLYVCM